MNPAFLFSEEALDWLRRHLGKDPSALALRESHPQIRQLCSQLALWNKARIRFPSWVDAGCIFHPLRLEQATAERLSQYKPYGNGQRAVDLTAGMGVDTWALAHRYSHVVACEPDAETFNLLQHNLSRLGIADRVKLMPIKAETAVEQGITDDVDLVYVDPERRNTAGSRIHDPGQCSPDIFSLLPNIRINTQSPVLIKTSPMYDRREAMRRIPTLANIYALGYAGECREILLEDHPGHSGIRLHCRWTPDQKSWFTMADGQESDFVPEGDPLLATWMLEGDATLYAMGLFKSWAVATFGNIGLSDKDGYAFVHSKMLSSSKFSAFRIVEVFPWKPGTIRNRLKEMGVNRIMAGRRDFRLRPEEIQRATGLSEGGEYYLKCTMIRGQEMAFLCTR